jgi:hypothetical protein
LFCHGSVPQPRCPESEPIQQEYGAERHEEVHDAKDDEEIAPRLQEESDKEMRKAEYDQGRSVRANHVAVSTRFTGHWKQIS